MDSKFRICPAPNSLPHRRLVRAERILTQRIAGSLKCSRARSATQREILAHAAAAVKVRCFVQGAEWRGIAIHIRQAVCADIAHRQRQKTRGADIARVRYEYDAMAIAHSKSAICGAALDLFAV